MARQIGPDPLDPAPDEAARVRAKPFRLIQAVFVADALAGMFVHYRAPHWSVPGEVLGMPVMEWVGLCLIGIGVGGYIMFEFLARGAMRRAGAPPPR
ncbi:MAG: hypothetical protein ACT4N4_04345 [Rhodospirillales bacterium]